MTHNNTLTERQLAALNGELGWNAKATEDGEVAFDSGHGYRIWLSNYASDPEYLHMHTGFGLSWFLDQAEAPSDLNSSDLQVRLLTIAADLTRRLKGVKVMIMPGDDMVVFSVEAVVAGQDRLPTIDHLAAIAPRVRSMIRAGVRELLDELKRLSSDAIDLSAWEAELADLPTWED